MKLRTRILLKICSLAVEDGAKELKYYFRMKHATFRLLAGSVMGGFIDPGRITREQDGEIGLLLTSNPGFSMLIFTDREGKTIYSKVGLSRTNVHLLPRNITGKTALGKKNQAHLIEMYQEWKNSIPGNKNRAAGIRMRMDRLAETGEKNSARYRKMQQKLVVLEAEIAFRLPRADSLPAPAHKRAVPKGRGEVRPLCCRL